MPPRRSYTPLLAFKFETAPLHSLFTNKEHASFQLLYHDMKGKQEKTMTTIGFIIDGKETPSASGKTFDRKDPVTGKVATTAPAASLADVDAVAKSAAKAFESWSETGPGERRALLNKAADLMESRADEFIRLMLEETGATAPWSGFNVHLGAGVLREAAALTTQITGEIIPSDKPGIVSMAVRQPVGVVLGMAPWNAPVILGVRAVAAALACGNTVILRSSDPAPAFIT